MWIWNEKISVDITHVLDINECASNPCLNHENCTDGINKYTCSCITGYTGNQCKVGKCVAYVYWKTKR